MGTTELDVALLGVAEGLDTLLDGNRVLVLKAKRYYRRKAARMLECGRESKYTFRCNVFQRLVRRSARKSSFAVFDYRL